MPKVDPTRHRAQPLSSEDKKHHLGETLILAKGAAVPHASKGTEWRLIGATDSIPQKYIFELVKKATKAGQSDSLDRVPKPTTRKVPKQPTTTRTTWHAGDLICIRKGDALPKTPKKYEWQLHRLIETWPVQYEYILKKTGTSLSSGGGTDATTEPSNEPVGNDGGGYSLGDKLILWQGQKPPSAPPGMRWNVTQFFETMPPKREYTLERA